MERKHHRILSIASLHRFWELWRLGGKCAQAAAHRIIELMFMPATLDFIMAATHRRVTRAKVEADVRQLEREAAQHAPRGFEKQLRQAADSGVAVIAELKKA